MNQLMLVSQRKPIVRDIVYWVFFILFWSLLWGLSDYQFSRNMVIQVSSLPARMLLVYISIYYLFPKVLDAKQYLKFLVFYVILLLVIVVIVQRPLMLYYIQPRFLPHFKDPFFFSSSEIINTALDVNIAAIIPVGYKIIMTSSNQPVHAEISGEESRISEIISLPYIEVQIDKLTHRIITSNIVFIESQRNHIRIQLRDKALVVRETISSIKEKLDDQNFVQVHRSFLVNLDEISATAANKIMCGIHIIPVGRMYKRDVQKKLNSAKICCQINSTLIN